VSPTGQDERTYRERLPKAAQRVKRSEINRERTRQRAEGDEPEIRENGPRITRIFANGEEYKSLSVFLFEWSSRRSRAKKQCGRGRPPSLGTHSGPTFGCSFFSFCKLSVLPPNTAFDGGSIFRLFSLGGEYLHFLTYCPKGIGWV